jgi:hypothetical protein
MTKVNVFVQGEGISDVLRIELDPGTTVGGLKKECEAIRKIPLNGEVAVFTEDADAPLGDDIAISTLDVRHGIRLHVHRCRHVEVKVSFAGRAAERSFTPAATIGRVKLWAAQEFGLSKEDAAEHVLQISGSTVQPDPDTHVGSLVSCPTCGIAFDLVPSQRINGSWMR